MELYLQRQTMLQHEFLKPGILGSLHQGFGVKAGLGDFLGFFKDRGFGIEV